VHRHARHVLRCDLGNLYRDTEIHGGERLCSLEQGKGEGRGEGHTRCLPTQNSRGRRTRLLLTFALIEATFLERLGRCVASRRAVSRDAHGPDIGKLVNGERRPAQSHRGLFPDSRYNYATVLSREREDVRERRMRGSTRKGRCSSRAFSTRLLSLRFLSVRLSRFFCTRSC